MPLEAPEASELRTQAAARIWQAEELSLAALAERIGVSKARADQLIRAARATRKEQQPGPSTAKETKTRAGR